MTKVTSKTEKVRVKVEPDAGSRLETLLTERRLAKEKLDEAKEALSQAEAGIRSELQGLRDAEHQPDVYEVPGHPSGAYERLTLTYTPAGWTLDSAALQAKEPEKWVEYAKPRRAYWTMK